ncbi:MAG: alpha-L-fucosidase, partial [Limisphaerales bacterium]
ANTNTNCPNRGEIPAEVYDNLYRRFDPTNFDAAAWVSLAQAAGVKYMVLTAKHADGFLLWDSKVDDYNIMHSPFHQDVCGELARAAHAVGMRIGWYFSPMDWRDPDCRSPHNDRFVRKMQAELTELLTRYGRIDVLWFDCDGRQAPWDQPRTYALVKKLQPGIIINNRLDMGTDDNPGLARNLHRPGDYFTPEQWVGGYDDQNPWESCMTISRRGQWAWGGHSDGVKTFSQLLEMVVRCAGGDGNVLLNVGPMPTGEIAPEQAARLREIGAWMAQYGQSIYGTRGGPFKPGDYGVSTRKGKTIYLHLAEPSEVLKLPPLPAKVVACRLLTGGQAQVSQSAAGLTLSLQPAGRVPRDTIVQMELDRSALDVPAMEVPAPVSLALHAKATASNVYQGEAEFSADKAVDGRDDTRWATDTGVHSAWLELDLGRPQTFSRARLRQAHGEQHRVRRFALEAWTNGQWEAFYHGQDLGERLVAKFPAVTAQRVRLHITEATDGPTIWEFELFGDR